jgi:hypothetical protein
VRGGARSGSGRPRIYADGLRRSVTMTRRHWDGLALLARMTNATPSLVLQSLVEYAAKNYDVWSITAPKPPKPPKTNGGWGDS